MHAVVRSLHSPVILPQWICGCALTPRRCVSRHDHARCCLRSSSDPQILEILFAGVQTRPLQHLAPDDVPYYHAKRATQALRERLWPYMTEGPLSLKLLINHITKWQVGCMAVM